MLFLLTDYRSLFVHPEWHMRVLPESLRNGIAIGPNDLLNAMQPQAAGESRPRWLTYLIVGIDQKLRVWIDDWAPVHPTLAPLAWLLQLVVTPYLLYRLLMNLTEDRAASLAGLAVYLSSNGFLSGFSMLFLPGKTLSNLIFVGALYAASVATRKLRPGQSLVEAPGWSKWVMLLVLFVGLFIDELPIAAFLIVPAVFWMYILPPWPWTVPSRLRTLARTAAFFALPMAAFLVVVLVVAPPIIERRFKTRFDFLGDSLRSAGGEQAGGSLLDGKVPLTPSIVLENFTNLFGLSLSPWFVSPLVQSPHGDFPGSQTSNLPQVALLLDFFGACAFVILRTRTMLRWRLLGLLLTLPFFFFFLSLIMVRHIPIVTGYYYGAGFASLFALLVGMLVAGLSLAAPALRPLAALVALGIVVVQIVNFIPINAGWVVTHDGQVTTAMLSRQPPEVQAATPIREPGVLTATELRAIWDAWHDGQLDAYLSREGVSGAAAYEVFELRALDSHRWLR